MNLRSIQVRMTLWATLVAIIASGGFRLQTYYSLQHSLYNELRVKLKGRIADIRQEILPIISQTPFDSLQKRIHDDYTTKDTKSFIRIRQKNGTIYSLTTSPWDYSYDPVSVPLTDYTEQITEHLEKIRGGHYLLIMGAKANVHGIDYVIEVGEPTDQIDKTLRILITPLLIGMPFVIVIATLGGALWVKQMLRPIEDMRSTAEQISSGNLRQRLPISKTGDAIEQLGTTLNQMLGRLDRSYQQAIRFSADASHELRTPITIIRGALEALIQKEEMPRALSENISSILEEIARLSRIVEGLLLLARLDAGVKGNYTYTNLAELVRATTEQMQLLAEEKDIRVAVTATSPTYIFCDNDLLKQVIINLFDNSIKYTSNGGDIAISVHEENRHAVLSFQDTGAGISSEDVSHIFERFYRTEEARSQPVQGTGLGLSITHSICLIHNGRISVDSNKGVGTTIKIEFPIASKDASENTVLASNAG
jgi:heavy metal sensor kinase